MDTSKEYIKMCEKAKEIQLEKFDGEGLVAGDCVWNGTQHLWLANDFFGFSGLWQKKIPYAYVACMEDLPASVVFSQEKTMGTITMRKEKYVLTKIAGFGIWLPRQDQLQEMVGSTIKLYEWGKFAYCDILPFIGGPSGEINIPDEFTSCRSWEQLWLAFVMREKYGKVWSEEDWKPL